MKNKWAKSLIALVVLVVVAGCSAVVEVPDIRNMTVENAKILLKEKKLLIEVEKEVASDNVAEGMIIEQTPMSASVVKAGTTVKVVVSKGAENTKVPYLIGISFDNALVKIREVGLNVGTKTYDYSDKIPEGFVISTNPNAGVSVSKGEYVNLVISSGPQPVTTVIVPNVKGYKVGQAKSILAKKGLKYSIKKKVTTEYYEGTVMRQYPSPGTQVAKGSVVKLTVAGVLR